MPVPFGRNGSPNYLVSLIALLTAAAALGTAAFLLALFVPGPLTAIIMLLILTFNHTIQLQDFGISRSSRRYGFFPAAAGALVLFVAARGLPQQLSGSGIKAAALAILILAVALMRELIWRGYIQTVLERQWGAAAGLLSTAGLAALFSFIIVALSSPLLLSYPDMLVELLILAPGSAVVLGYLYLRTKNILSCTLPHGLMLSYSSLIIF